MKPPNIHTKNCIIKIPDISHTSLLCDFYSSNKDNFKAWEPERNVEFYTLDYWQSQIQLSNHLFKQKQAVKMIALNKDECQIIGTCNFSNIVFGCFLACHLGYAIDKSFEGKGFMYEIINAGIKYMHDEFKLHRIMANHITNNHRSEKLLTRLGFEKEGYAKDYLKINGKWQDHILNSLVLPSK